MQPNQQTPPQVPPDPNIPPSQPVRRTVIQPLSSEDEIRRVAASSGMPVRPPEPGANPPGAFPSGAIEAEPAESENIYQSGLVTEPLHHPSQASLRYGTPRATVPDAPPARRAKKSAPKVMAVMLLIGVLGTAVWLFLFNRISSTDLVQQGAGGSTYLRPRQWSQLSPGISAYGNATDKEKEESTAMISVTAFPLAATQMYMDTDGSYDRYRKLILEQFSESAVKLVMSTNAPMDCQLDDIRVTKREEDTEKNGTTVGLIRAAASCQRGVHPITMKLRLVAGVNDKRVRMIIVGGTTVDWLKNAASFEQMLDGVEERSTS